MTEFKLNGFTYRTNADASTVEAFQNGSWVQTHSLRVIAKARSILGL